MDKFDAEGIYYHLQQWCDANGLTVSEEADEALSAAAQLLAPPAGSPPAMGVTEIEDEPVAEGFLLTWEDYQETPRWCVTGNAPDDLYREDDDLWSNYSIEDALCRAGILQRNQCDSESGQFFVYPETREQGLEVGRFIQAAIDKARAPRPSVWES